MILLLLIFMLPPATAKVDPCNVALAGEQLSFDFDPPLVEILNNNGWKPTPIFRVIDQRRINDANVWTPAEHDGRFVVSPFINEGQASPTPTARDRAGVSAVISGTQVGYVLESAEAAWQARVSLSDAAVASLSALPIKNALRRLGFEQIGSLRKAKVFTRDVRGKRVLTDADEDGVVVMKAKWSPSEITILNLQTKGQSPDEARAILGSILAGKNYYTQDATAALLKIGPVDVDR